MHGQRDDGAPEHRCLHRDAVVDSFASELLRRVPRGAAIVGPPWSGGSHLGRTLLQVAGEQGFETADLRATPGLQEVGFGVLAPLFDLPDLTPDLFGVHAVREVLQRGAPRRVVLIDDAQWIDALTASMIGQLPPATFIPILVIDASDPARLASHVQGVLRDVSLIRHDIPRLDDHAIRDVIDEAAGQPVDPLTKLAIVSRSSGLPALAAELTLEAVRTGALREHAEILRQRGELRIPAGVRDRVATGLLALDAGARRIVDVLAIAGELPQDLLASVFGEPAILDPVVQPFIDLRIEGDRHVVGLRSPLVADVARADLPAVARVELARTVRHVLLDKELRRQDDPLLVGTLTLLAGDPISPEDALAWAARANTLGRVELALQFATRATELRPDDCGAACLRAELLGLEGRNHEAEQLLADLRPSTNDDIALVAMTRAHNLFNRLDRPDQANDVLLLAIAAVGDSDWADELRGLIAVFAMFSGRPGDALEQVEANLEVATGRNLTQVITAAAPALVFVGRPEEAIALAERGFEARVALGDQTMLAHAGLHLVAQSLALGEAGRIDDAIELADVIEAGAAAERSKEGLLWAALVAGRALLPAGRLDDAARRFRAGGDLALELGLRNHARWALCGVVLALAMQGRTDDARRAEVRLEAVPDSSARLMASEKSRAHAWVSALRGDAASARSLLLDGAQEARETGQHLLTLLTLHEAVRLDLGLPVDDLVQAGTLVVGDFAAVRVAHGVALDARDGAGLIAVAEQFESMGAHLLAAEAMNQAATTASRIGRHRDAESLRQRVEVMRIRCREAHTPALAWSERSAALTRREREVAQGAAAGLASKEIAANLGISVRTVNNLLQRVYRKLAVHDRADLAIELSRIDPDG